MTALRLAQSVLTLIFLAAFAVNLLLWMRRQRKGPLVDVPEGPLLRSVVYAFGTIGPCLFVGGKALESELLASIGLDLANLCFIALNVVGLRTRRRLG